MSQSNQLVGETEQDIATSIVRTVPASHRPFAAAVAARPEPSAGCRAAATWRQFVTDLLSPVTQRWPEAVSIDLLDGDVHVVGHVGLHHVEVRVDAPHTDVHPMHIRSLLLVLDKVRPSMRREAPVSANELDVITSELVLDAMRTYPLERCPHHRPALTRLHQRFGWDLGVLNLAA